MEYTTPISTGVSSHICLKLKAQHTFDDILKRQRALKPWFTIPIMADIFVHLSKSLSSLCFWFLWKMRNLNQFSSSFYTLTLLLCHLYIDATKFIFILFEFPFIFIYFSLTFVKGSMLRVLRSLLPSFN